MLRLFHAYEADARPCPQCGDDIYKSPEGDCPSCYGTMFDGGVREAAMVWALYTDHQMVEPESNRGINQPDHRHVQLEAFPMLTEHDVLVRVKAWNFNTVSQIYGYYLLDKVDRRSLRTGSRFGQYTNDVVGQKADLAQLPETLKMITRYPVVGKTFAPPPQLGAFPPSPPSGA